jgi:predicted dehydrogenase
LKKIKFAVIGCGNIALKSTIPAILYSGVSTINVCVDIDPKKGEEIQSKFNLPFVTSFSDALANFNFDTVYISTPVGTHKQLIIEAANHKKNIICEKSLAVNLQEVQKIVEVCKDNNVALFEGFMYQFHTQHKYVNDLIDNGEIGEPFHFQAWFGFPPLPIDNFRYKKDLGGGAILDAGAYTVHAARHFFGSEPIEIFSTIGNEGHDVETRGAVMLNFGEGKTAHLVFGFNNMYQNKYNIWGTKGVISLNRAFSLPSDYRSVLLLEKQGEKKEFIMEPCNHFVEEIKYFCGNIREDKIKQFWLSEVIFQAKSLEKIFR